MRTFIILVAILSINAHFVLAAPTASHQGSVTVFDNSMNGISQSEIQIDGDAAQYLYNSIPGQGIKDAELPVWYKAVGDRTQCAYSPSKASQYTCLVRVGNCEAADEVTGWPVPHAASCR